MDKLKKHIPVFQKIRTDLKRLGRYYPYDINSTDMCGLCAISSYIAFLYLVKQGFKPNFMFAEKHCWLEVSGYYIDLTATQFGLEEEIIILPRNRFMKKVAGIYSYRGAMKIDSTEQLKIESSKWTKGQNPSYLEKKSKIVKHLIKELV